MKQLILTPYRGAHIAALLDDKGQLLALEADRPNSLHYGAILAAKVTHKTPSGLFLDIGNGQEGFMTQPHDSPTLSLGTKLTLQVKAEAYRDKNARLSTDISLPGRFCIYLPNSTGVLISRKAKGCDICARHRTLLKESGLEGGFIVRGASADASPEALLQEARYLASLASSSLPFSGLTCAMRILTDGNPLPNRIITSQIDAFLNTWVENIHPDLANRISLEKDSQALLESLGVCDHIDALLEKTVSLEGGSLIIEPTEALVAIDINVGGNSKTTFCEMAAHEIARQVRLRNLSGMIIMDFPRQTEQESRRILDIMQTAGADDPCTFSIAGYSPLRLLEATRNRRTPPLSECLR